MGWFKESLDKLAASIAGSPPLELTFAPSVSATDISGIGEPIEPDSCYIELYLESLRLKRARRFATKFQGVAYSFVSLSREGEERAHLAAISKPEKLAELDKDSLDKVITVSKQMMGPTAFRGGSVSLELGLFSVKSGNLLSPFLDYLTEVSSTAGISYVGAVKPFLPLITKGMDLLTGQIQDTALEVGLDEDVAVTKSFVGAILGIPKGTIDTTKLSLDKDDHKLLINKKPLDIDCGYAVFSLRKSTRKSDYGEIPELKEKYSKFQSAIRGNKQKDAMDALTAFRLATIASSDLISSDARKLVEKAKEKYDEAFPPGGVAAFGINTQIEELSKIGLYD